MVIADGAARLGDIGNARLARALDVVAKREEGVRAYGHTGVLRNPSFLFFRSEHFGAHLEGVLPNAVG